MTRQIPQSRKVPSRQLCERYAVTGRTIDRWLLDGILPTPIRINGIRYWDAAELDEFDRVRMAARETSAA
jgi:predicted DNA-binding transcriptional regulator AlpA